MSWSPSLDRQPQLRRQRRGGWATGRHRRRVVEARRPGTPGPVARLLGLGRSRSTWPGYGQLAATLGPCWATHDLCLYGLDIACRAVVGALPPSHAHPAHAVRPGRIPDPHPARPRRAAHAPKPTAAATPQARTVSSAASPEHAMTDATLRRALAFAAARLAGVPCQTGQKIPATAARLPRRHHRPSGRSPRWFARHPDWNLAIATGAPGPDVLDVDDHGPAGNGYAALQPASQRLGCSTARAAYVPPPAAACTPTSPARTSATATCPPTTWTSGPAGGYVLDPALAGRRQALPARSPDPDGDGGSTGHGGHPGCWSRRRSSSAREPRHGPVGISMPASPQLGRRPPRARVQTATRACSGPPTARWRPTARPTSAHWPQQPGRPASA